MSMLQTPPTGLHSSRRNIIKAGIIGASAILAYSSKMSLATANCGHNGKDVGEGCEHHDYKCFLKGTIIRTTDGDRKIEDLVQGDLLPTVFGGMSPIQWIGRYSLKKRDPAKAWIKKVLPVRVSRSALGLDVPCADLYVTREHALLIDGVLVTAGSLINGTTITVHDPCELVELEFFHIKLERHNVIYAEGAPCETMINVEQSAINFAEYLCHYAPPATQEAPCVPLLSCTGARREINSRLRSAISPWIDRRQKLDIIRDELEERSGRGASYPVPPPQIPACGFPAPGSCRKSSAIDVRGLGGPFSFDPPVGASCDTPNPALCPGRASPSTISPSRVPSLHALRRRSSRPCSSPSTVLWTRPTPPAFLTGYAHSSFPARPGALRLRATGGLPGSDAFLSGVMWSPTPAE